MARLILPRYPLRSRKRGGRRSIQKRVRQLRLEQLDRRLVLSGMADIACLDGPTDSGSDAQTDVAQAAQVEGATAPHVKTPVFLADDGVLHVQPADDDPGVVVRQFIDFHLEEVVEIEVAGRWTAFPAAQVSAIQVQLLDSGQTLNVDAGVSKPVQLVEPPAVQQAVVVLADSLADDLVDNRTDAFTTTSMDASVAVALPPASNPTLTTPPAGEPGGSTAGPPLSPPRITDFVAARNGDIWQLSGHVTDDKSVTGLVVQFGGLLPGSSAVVNEQGYFQIVVTFPPGTSGLVIAHTTDTDGLTSNLAYCSVNYLG